jgi:hypothetical protein
MKTLILHLIIPIISTLSIYNTYSVGLESGVTENVTYKNGCTTLSGIHRVLNPVSSTNKTDRYDIDEILLKMELSAINLI